MELGNQPADARVARPMEEDALVARAVTPPLAQAAVASPIRAWFYLIGLSIQRQVRARQMVWIALALLAVTVTIVGLNTARGRWSMDHWRVRPEGAPGPLPVSYGQYLEGRASLAAATTATDPVASSISSAVLDAERLCLARSGFLVFARFFVYSIFLSFLLPVWSLSFSTEALGGERDSRNLVWLLSRPLSRPAIYLAKFVAVLPWVLGLNLGGFGLLCLAAGGAGLRAFEVFWPAVAWASLAFCALFHLMGALFRRAAVVAIVYSFFLETILGNMPGYMKRFSISFYTRCLMFDAAERLGVQPPEKPEIYLPVDGTTALCVLMTVTVVLLVAGMAIFARLEYRDES
jgi:ABC-2 type transport system permease protein